MIFRGKKIMQKNLTKQKIDALWIFQRQFKFPKKNLFNTTDRTQNAVIAKFFVLNDWKLKSIDKLITYHVLNKFDTKKINKQFMTEKLSKRRQKNKRDETTVIKITIYNFRFKNWKQIKNNSKTIHTFYSIVINNDEKNIKKTIIKIVELNLVFVFRFSKLRIAFLMLQKINFLAQRMRFYCTQLQSITRIFRDKKKREIQKFH